MGSLRFTEEKSARIVEITGVSLEDLFISAASALKKTVFGEFRRYSRKSEIISLTASTEKELLVNLLNEINFQYLSKKFIFSEIEELKINNFVDCWILDAELIGESYSSKRHLTKNEVKTISPRDLEIKKVNGNFLSKITFK